LKYVTYYKCVNKQFNVADVMLRRKHLNLDLLSNLHKAKWGAQTYALNYFSIT